MGRRRRLVSRRVARSRCAFAVQGTGDGIVNTTSHDEEEFAAAPVQPPAMSSPRITPPTRQPRGSRSPRPP
jgi:hypothetical protein